MWLEFSYIFHPGIFTNDKQIQSGWDSWVDYQTTSKNTVLQFPLKKLHIKVSLKSLTQMSWDVGNVVLHHLQCNFPEMCKVNKNCTQNPVTLWRLFFGVRIVFCATCGKSIESMTHWIVIWSFQVQYLPIYQITKFSFESLLKLTVSQTYVQINIGWVANVWKLQNCEW